jgi:hypothetical protein
MGTMTRITAADNQRRHASLCSRSSLIFFGLFFWFTISVSPLIRVKHLRSDKKRFFSSHSIAPKPSFDFQLREDTGTPVRFRRREEEQENERERDESSIGIFVSPRCLIDSGLCIGRTTQRMLH